ncbi:MAG: hypothetical protein KatS3mg088_373 [Patescibacteria group bacterium]|nr:MAG: hypothetical protein KatS3mg088_373 [Patescibacteria group bacterium]
MKYNLRHLPHYFGLIGIFIVGIFGFLIFSYDRTFQAAVLVSVAVSYVVWGVIHHKIHKDFYISVLFEYIAVAILGLIIIFSLLFA